MQIRLRGTENEVYAMREWLPALFPVVRRVVIRKDHDGPQYRLYADVYPWVGAGRPSE
jgi:hypothetical protein